MQPFIRHAGIAVPLPVSNVDTDQILPAEYLKRITRTGFEDGLFSSWRADPAFVLNDPAYAGASILVAGADFGTGSSREHAVWALQDYGFRVVLSSRFADIFRSNAGKSGLVAGQITESDADRLSVLLTREPGARVEVDLETLTVSAEGIAPFSFGLDDYTRWRLLNGYDDISITLQSEAEIAAYERERPTFRPSLPGS